MLTSLSEAVADCYRRAAECQELARVATNDRDREFYLARENDWLLLARTHQFRERMSLALEENDKRRGITQTRACPACRRMTPVRYSGVFVCTNCHLVFEDRS